MSLFVVVMMLLLTAAVVGAVIWLMYTYPINRK